MQQFKTRNETNIRKSIARTDKTEREERIKQGLLTPPPKQPKQPRTPKQQMIINKLGDIVAKSQEKQKESKYMSVLQDAEPLIFKREMKKATKIVGEKVSGYQSKISDLDKELAKLEKQKAKLKPVIENYSATTLQTAMRNKRARDTLKQTRTNKNTAATTIQKAMRGKITRNKIINDYEDQISRAEQNISDLRLNINQQRPEGLRKAVKKLQDRRSELVNRAPNMDRKLKTEEWRKININEDQYKDVIIEERRGPKVRGIIEQFGGAKKKK